MNKKIEKIKQELQIIQKDLHDLSTMEEHVENPQDAFERGAKEIFNEIYELKRGYKDELEEGSKILKHNMEKYVNELKESTYKFLSKIEVLLKNLFEKKFKFNFFIEGREEYNLSKKIDILWEKYLLIHEVEFTKEKDEILIDIKRFTEEKDEFVRYYESEEYKALEKIKTLLFEKKYILIFKCEYIEDELFRDIQSLFDKFESTELLKEIEKIVEKYILAFKYKYIEYELLCDIKMVLKGQNEYEILSEIERLIEEQNEYEISKKIELLKKIEELVNKKEKYNKHYYKSYEYELLKEKEIQLIKTQEEGEKARDAWIKKIEESVNLVWLDEKLELDKKTKLAEKNTKDKKTKLLTIKRNVKEEQENITDELLKKIKLEIELKTLKLEIAQKQEEEIKISSEYLPVKIRISTHEKKITIIDLQKKIEKKDAEAFSKYRELENFMQLESSSCEIKKSLQPSTVSEITEISVFKQKGSFEEVRAEAQQLEEQTSKVDLNIVNPQEQQSLSN